MSLPVLKSRLAPVASAVRMLAAEAFRPPRPAGRAWQRRRLQLQLAQGSRCQGCGRLWLPERDQVDHRVPREAGGSDEDKNLQLLCDECHAAKTERERLARERMSR